MLNSRQRANLRSAYIKASLGEVSFDDPRVQRAIRIGAKHDPEFMGQLRQEGTDLRRQLAGQPSFTSARELATASNVPAPRVFRGETDPYSGRYIPGVFTDPAGAEAEGPALLDLGRQDLPGAARFAGRVVEPLPILGQLIRSEGEVVPESVTVGERIGKGLARSVPAAVAGAAAGAPVAAAAGLGATGTAITTGVLSNLLGAASQGVPLPGAPEGLNEANAINLGAAAGAGALGGAGRAALAQREARRVGQVLARSAERAGAEGVAGTAEQLGKMQGLRAGDVSRAARDIRAGGVISSPVNQVVREASEIAAENLDEAGFKELGDIARSVVPQLLAVEAGEGLAEVGLQAAAGQPVTAVDVGVAIGTPLAMGLVEAGGNRAAEASMRRKQLPVAPRRPEVPASDVLAPTPAQSAVVAGMSPAEILARGIDEGLVADGSSPAAARRQLAERAAAAESAGAARAAEIFETGAAAAANRNQGFRDTFSDNVSQAVDALDALYADRRVRERDAARNFESNVQGLLGAPRPELDPDAPLRSDLASEPELQPTPLVPGPVRPEADVVGGQMLDQVERAMSPQLPVLSPEPPVARTMELLELDNLELARRAARLGVEWRGRTRREVARDLAKAQAARVQETGQALNSRAPEEQLAALNRELERMGYGPSATIAEAEARLSAPDTGPYPRFRNDDPSRFRPPEPNPRMRPYLEGIVERARRLPGGRMNSRQIQSLPVVQAGIVPFETALSYLRIKDRFVEPRPADAVLARRPDSRGPAPVPRVPEPTPEQVEARRASDAAKVLAGRAARARKMLADRGLPVPPVPGIGNLAPGAAAPRRPAAPDPARAKLGPAKVRSRGRENPLRVVGEAKRVPSRYAIVSVSDLIPSHDAMKFEKRPDYGFENQNDYSREIPREQVRSQARDLDPSILLETGQSNTDGPPVVRADGTVLGGNSRAMSLQHALERFPAKFRAYVEALRADAQEYGFRPEDIGDDAVLVRLVDVDDARAADLIPKLNQASAKAQSEESLARAYAATREFSPDVADAIADLLGEKPVTLRRALSQRGQRIIGTMVEKGVIPKEQMQRFYDSKKNRLNAAGQRLAESILLGRMVGADRLDDMLDSIDADDRFGKMVARVAPAMLRLSEMTRKGWLPEWANVARMLPEVFDSVDARDVDGAIEQTDIMAPETAGVRRELERLFEAPLRAKDRKSAAPYVALGVAVNGLALKQAELVAKLEGGKSLFGFDGPARRGADGSWVDASGRPIPEDGIRLRGLVDAITARADVPGRGDDLFGEREAFSTAELETMLREAVETYESLLPPEVIDPNTGRRTAKTPKEKPVETSKPTQAAAATGDPASGGVDPRGAAGDAGGGRGEGGGGAAPRGRGGRRGGRGGLTSPGDVQASPVRVADIRAGEQAAQAAVTRLGRMRQGGAKATEVQRTAFAEMQRQAEAIASSVAGGKVARGAEAIGRALDAAVARGSVDATSAKAFRAMVESDPQRYASLGLAFADAGGTAPAALFDRTRRTIIAAAAKGRDGVRAMVEELVHDAESLLAPADRAYARASWLRAVSDEIEAKQREQQAALRAGAAEDAKAIGREIAFLSGVLDGSKGVGDLPDGASEGLYRLANTSEFLAGKVLDFATEDAQYASAVADGGLRSVAARLRRFLSDAARSFARAAGRGDDWRAIWKSVSPVGQKKRRAAVDVALADPAVAGLVLDARAGDDVLMSPRPAYTQEQEDAIRRVAPSLASDDRSFVDRAASAMSRAVSSVRSRAVEELFDQFRPILDRERAAFKRGDGRVGREESDSAYEAVKRARRSQRLLGTVLNVGMLDVQEFAKSGMPKIAQNSMGLMQAPEMVALREARGEAGLQEAMLYMVGERALEYARQGRATGISDADAKALASFGQVPEVRAAANAIQRVFDNILDFAEVAGVVSKAGRQSFLRTFYVPFFREMDAADADTAPEILGAVNTGGAFGQKSGIFEMKGTERAIGDPVENWVRMAGHLLDASMKNRAAQEIVRVFGDEMESVAGVRLVEPASATTPKRETVTVMRDGKPERYVVHAPDLLRAAQALGPKTWGAWMRMFSVPRRILSRAVTAAPSFILPNMLRDSINVSLQGGEGLAASSPWQYGKNFLGVLFGREKQVKAMERLRAAGAAGGGYYEISRVPSQAAGDLRASFRDAGRSAASRVLRDTLTPMGWLRLMERIGEAGESAARITLAEAAAKRGASEAEQARVAREIIDYEDLGANRLVQFFAETVPFFRARMAGLYKLGRTGVEADRARAAFWMRGATMAMASLALQAWNQEENAEELGALEDWERDWGWNVWVPTEDGKVRVKIAKPFEPGFVFGTLPERMFAATVEGQDQGDWNLVAERTGRFLMDTMQFNPTPQVAAPLIEQWANRSFFTGRPIVNPAIEGLLPEQQYTERTPRTARALADLAPDATGELFNSPARLEALVRGYFGTLGAYILSAGDILSEAATGQSAPGRNPLEMTLESVVELDRDPGRSRYVSRFYEFAEELERIVDTERSLRMQGKTAEAAALREEYRSDIRFYRLSQRLRNQMAKLTRRSRQALDRGDRETVSRLNARKASLAKRFDEMRTNSPEASS